MVSAISSDRALVLIVEDEALLLLDAIGIVEEAGFRAMTASNADEALAILASRNDIRIVFTDIEMPGSMDGLRLAAAIRDRWPPIELIVTSGKSRPQDADLPSGGCFFPKPYEIAKLVATMQRMAGPAAV